jgi:hypothetical protein
MNMFDLQLIRVTKQKNPIRFSRATRFQQLHAHVSVEYVLTNETELDLCLTNHIKRLFFSPFTSHQILSCICCDMNVQNCQ